jgi:hypothetical protein
VCKTYRLVGFSCIANERPDASGRRVSEREPTKIPQPTVRFYRKRRVSKEGSDLDLACLTPVQVTKSAANTAPHSGIRYEEIVSVDQQTFHHIFENL